jgi:hypothetical protein
MTTIDKAGRRDDWHIADDIDRPGSTSERKPSAPMDPKRDAEPLDPWRHSPSYDADLRAFVGNETRKALSAKTYLGMDPASEKRDVEELKEECPSTSVTVIAHSKREGCVTVAGHTYDLGTEKGRSDFATLLRAQGLSEGRARQVAQVLERAMPRSRDELANLALQWVKGERGEPLPSRLVLGGACNVGLFDAKRPNASLFYADLMALARAMPRAAAQIEHVELRGGRGPVSGMNDNEWFTAFPKLRSIEATWLGHHATRIRVG